jgi:hypothetical protein
LPSIIYATPAKTGGLHQQASRPASYRVNKQPLLIDGYMAADNNSQVFMGFFTGFPRHSAQKPTNYVRLIPIRRTGD